MGNNLWQSAQETMRKFARQLWHMPRCDISKDPHEARDCHSGRSRELYEACLGGYELGWEVLVARIWDHLEGEDGPVLPGEVGACAARVGAHPDMPLGFERAPREELADKRLLGLAEVCVNPTAAILAEENTAPVDLSQGPIDKGLVDPQMQRLSHDPLTLTKICEADTPARAAGPALMAGMADGT
jgi:hypothetical protein